MWFGLFFLGLATLLDRIDREQVTIAVDGSLYKHHPRLENWMKKYISLLSPGHKVRDSENRWEFNWKAAKWFQVISFLFCFFFVLRTVLREIIRFYYVSESLMLPSLCASFSRIIIIHLICLQFKLIHAEDGSGKGAALVAAIAQRLQKRLQ